MPVLKPHVAINVTHLENSLRFYRKLFSAEPAKVRPGYAKVDFTEPALNFALNEAPASARGTALSHLGIQVTSTADVLAFRRRWIAAGLEARDEMNTECCFALQNKTWVRDPDGNEWEVFVVLEDCPSPPPADTRSCCGPACCTPAAGAEGKSHAAL